MAWKPDPKWLPDPEPTPLAGRRAATDDTGSSVGVLDTQALPTQESEGAPVAVIHPWRTTWHHATASKPAPAAVKKPARTLPKPSFTLPSFTLPKPSLSLRKPSHPVVLAGAGVGVVAIVLLAAGVYGLADSSDQSPAVPTAARMAVPVIASIPTFCPDNTTGRTVTTAGPGTDTTAAGVIAALDYAYYTQRNAANVNALMVSAPSSVAGIQAAIDAVSAGTKACVKTTPDTAPGVWLVDVQLHAPTGRDTWLHQRITVAAQTGQSGPRFKIARIEDRQQ